jgi:transglutaminase-like putative cysteine protease
MSSRSCWRASLLAAAFTLLATPAAGRAPAWLRDLADVPVPPQKETVDAVQLLSDVEVEVRADGRVRKRVRAAYRILKPVGETRVIAQAVYDSRSRVRSMQAWTIPAKGAHLESDMSAAADAALSTMGGAELVNDIRQKVLVVPVGGAGAVSGYEYEMDISPLAPADSESFQDAVPVIEARYSLLVPRGWQVTATWLHHPDVEPVRASDRQWQWTLRDLPAIEPEARMPSPASIAARLQVAFTPAGAVPQLSTWQGIGSWYAQLAQERLAPNDAIRAKVAELTRNQGSALARFRALAGFVQSDIRYVAIELGIGGFQPHAATDVFANRFGDCKDKVTLLGTMLREVGIDSVPVLVNTDRHPGGAAAARTTDAGHSRGGRRAGWPRAGVLRPHRRNLPGGPHCRRAPGFLGTDRHQRRQPPGTVAAHGLSRQWPAPHRAAEARRQRCAERQFHRVVHRGSGRYAALGTAFGHA